MKWSKWLENWNMTSLRISVPFLEMEWSPSEPDKAAAWELYIELLTRVTTQDPGPAAGNEVVALESVYSLFPTTRSIVKGHGRDCREFTKLAIVVLNQKVRPFTSKWHRVATGRGFDSPEQQEGFWTELRALQLVLRQYSRMLAEMAGVEDLTSLEPDHAK